MKHHLIFSAFTLVAVFGFTACNDDDDNSTQPQAEVGTVSLQLSHKVGTEALQLNRAENYTSPGNQAYRVSDFKYYLSNVKFYGPNGAVYMEPESYHLVNQTTPTSLKIDLSQVAPGTYDSLLFAIGVDNDRNHSGTQAGALDPANGMSWGWATGYKFLQLEGNSPESPATGNNLQYHIGLDQNYRLVRIGLSPALVVTNGSKHTLHINADVNRMFGTTADPVLFNQVHTVMGVTNSATLADNYAKMFSLQEITTP